MLAALAVGALHIERGDAPPDAVASLFRSAHTLKGGARMLGLDSAAAVAETVEGALAPYRAGEPPRALGAELLDGVDALRAAIWPDEARPAVDSRALGTGVVPSPS